MSSDEELTRKAVESLIRDGREYEKRRELNSVAKPNLQPNVPFLKRMITANNRHNETVARQEASGSTYSSTDESDRHANAKHHSRQRSTKRRRYDSSSSSSSDSSSDREKLRRMKNSARKKLVEIESVLKKFQDTKSSTSLLSDSDDYSPTQSMHGPSSSTGTNGASSSTDIHGAGSNTGKHHRKGEQDAKRKLDESRKGDDTGKHAENVKVHGRSMHDEKGASNGEKGRHVGKAKRGGGGKHDESGKNTT